MGSRTEGGFTLQNLSLFSALFLCLASMVMARFFTGLSAAPLYGPWMHRPRMRAGPEEKERARLSTVLVDTVMLNGVSGSTGLQLRS